jgi:hypothetical protein
MQERSFSGKTLRPAPEIHLNADGSFGALVTPWGPRHSVKRVIDTLTDFITSAKTDTENTSPFQKLTCLSPLANTLRAAIMLTNDVLYREENKNEYLAGVELLVFSRNSAEFSFVQIGQPHVFLSRQGQPLIPIGMQIDLALEWSRPHKPLSSLPHELLGLHSTSNIRIISFRPAPGDKLIFLSRSQLPASFFQTIQDQHNVEELSQLLAKDQPDSPFWLGVYDLPTWKATISEDAA